MDIITDYDALGARSDEVNTKKEGQLIQKIVLELKNTMRETGAVSLTAPQIGYNKRIFCIKFGENDYRAILNPVITQTKGFQLARESCHSIPGKEFIRPRFNNIQIIYQTPLGKIESRAIVGKSAIVFEHCIDHLDGVLLSDIGFEIDDQWDKATDDERAEVIKSYLESLDIKQKELEKEINEDEDLRDINDAIKFMDSVNKGETQIKLGTEKNGDIESDISNSDKRSRKSK